MATLSDVTAIVVNYKTLEHTRACLESLRRAYPALRVLVVDNGSKDASADYLEDVAADDPALDVVVNQSNVFHGPALHQGMQRATTDYAFLLDSDVVVDRGGFLEVMLDRFTGQPDLYAIGKQGWTNRYGYSPVSRGQRHTAYVHPFAGLFDRRLYPHLPPFLHHGAPLYRNMWGAAKAGYRVEHMPVEQYVTHLGEVTASVHGYGYDRRLELQLLLSRLEAKARRSVAGVRGRILVPPEIPDAAGG